MYILLLILCFLSAGNTALAKLFQKGTSLDFLHLIIYNFLNALFASVFFFISLKFDVPLNLTTLIYAIVFAALIMVNLCANLFSMKYTPLPILTIITMASGILLPSAFGILFFEESLSIQLLISWILIFAATIIPFIQKSQDKKRFTGKALFCCTLTFVLSGLSTILIQLYAKDSRVVASEAMFLITNLVIVIASFIFLLIYTKGKLRLKTITRAYKPLHILNIAGRTLLNNTSSVLQVIILTTIPVSTYSVATASLGLILTTLLSYFIFKETQRKGTFIALLLAIAATIINVI